MDGGRTERWKKTIVCKDTNIELRDRRKKFLMYK